MYGLETLNRPGFLGDFPVWFHATADAVHSR